MQFGGQPTPWSEVEIEGLRLRSVSQILIQEIGAAGPENAEDSASRACGVIQRMADQIVSADARIAELEQSVTVRDTEIARLETDLELARIGARRYETVRRMSVPMWKDALKLNLSTSKPFDEIIDQLRPFMFPQDAARAGNGGGV